VTRTPFSGSKGQGHQAALLSATLTHKAAAAVSVGRIRRAKVLLRYVCSAAREALGRPLREEWGGAILCRHAHSWLLLLLLCPCPNRVGHNAL